MALTLSERQSFTSERLAQLDRMRADRLRDYLEPPAPEGLPERPADEKAAQRAKVIGQLASLSPEQLRMRVNILTFGHQLEFAAESDYTKDEQDAIGWGWKANIGRKAQDEIPAILAADAEMVTDGVPPEIRKAILKNR